MTTKDQRLRPIPNGWLMLISGAGASWGEFCTIPLDTAKVRLQLQSNTNPVYSGLIDCLRKMTRDEGAKSLWRGTTAGIQRQLAFAPIRIGLYEPVRNFYMHRAGYSVNDTPNIWIRIVAGLTTSAVGITVASPTDLVKVRLQAQARGTADVPVRYTGVFDAYKKIVAEEGMIGLWNGYGPNLLRNCIVSATELVAYDQAKQTFLAAGAPDNLMTHIGSGLTAGLAATLLGSPVDVIKSNVMNMQKKVEKAESAAENKGAAPKAGASNGGSSASGGAASALKNGAPSAASLAAKADVPFTGPLSCARHLLATQGPLAFYRGFVPNFCRIGSWNIITWVTIEQLKAMYYKMSEP